MNGKITRFVAADRLKAEEAGRFNDIMFDKERLNGKGGTARSTREQTRAEVSVALQNLEAVATPGTRKAWFMGGKQTAKGKLKGLWGKGYEIKIEQREIMAEGTSTHGTLLVRRKAPLEKIQEEEETRLNPVDATNDRWRAVWKNVKQKGAEALAARGAAAVVGGKLGRLKEVEDGSEVGLCCSVGASDRMCVQLTLCMSEVHVQFRSTRSRCTFHSMECCVYRPKCKKERQLCCEG